MIRPEQAAKILARVPVMRKHLQARLHFEMYIPESKTVPDLLDLVEWQDAKIAILEAEIDELHLK